jgi:hypothetical protein
MPKKNVKKMNVPPTDNVLKHENLDTIKKQPSWVGRLGSALIKSVEVHIGGRLVDWYVNDCEENNLKDPVAENLKCDDCDMNK